MKPMATESHPISCYIDVNKKVRVYRNLHKKCLSVRQDGVVKCHTTQISLTNFRTIVLKSGQDRVRKEKSKNVHSFIEGFFVEKNDLDNLVELYYNPYHTDHWIERQTRNVVKNGEFVDISSRGVFALIKEN